MADFFLSYCCSRTVLTEFHSHYSYTPLQRNAVGRDCDWAEWPLPSTSQEEATSATSAALVVLEVEAAGKQEVAIAEGPRSARNRAFKLGAVAL